MLSLGGVVDGVWAFALSIGTITYGIIFIDPKWPFKEKSMWWLSFFALGALEICFYIVCVVTSREPQNSVLAYWAELSYRLWKALSLWSISLAQVSVYARAIRGLLFIKWLVWTIATFTVIEIVEVVMSIYFFSKSNDIDLGPTIPATSTIALAGIIIALLRPLSRVEESVDRTWRRKLDTYFFIEASLVSVLLVLLSSISVFTATATMHGIVCIFTMGLPNLVNSLMRENAAPLASDAPSSSQGLC